MTDNSLKTWCKQRDALDSHRQLLLLSGSKSWCQSQLQALALPPTSLLVSEQALIGGEHEYRRIQKKHYKQYLGFEFSHVVYNAFDGLKPSALLGLEGTVKKGGLFVILCPDLKKWPEYEAMASGIQFSYQEDHSRSAFVQRLLKIVKFDESTAIYSEANGESKLPFSHVITSLENSSFSLADTSEARVLTKHQQKLKADHLNALRGNTAISVITAKRGRGKSTLLAHLAAELCLSNGIKEIYITAPHRYNCERAIKEFRAYIEQNQSDKVLINDADTLYTKITYVPIDKLNTLDDKAYLIIDEAASLAPDILLLACSRFHKVMMASTQVGYEGSGLGFSLRVLPALELATRGCIRDQLFEPMRWFDNDALENSFERVFAPNIEFSQDHKTILRQLETKDVRITDAIFTYKLNKQELINDEYLLLSVFSILLQSHYQTTPDDLMRMLDADDQLVFITVLKAQYSETQDSVVLAAALVQQEGNLIGDAPELLESIACGERRVPGHLVAQNLCTTYSDPFFMCEVSWRISRIAVSHQFQGYGIGSFLLNELEVTARQDNQNVCLTTSFGITPKLLQFWQHNNFEFIKAGLRVDTSSGKHSVIMAKPLTEDCTFKLRGLLQIRRLHLQQVDWGNELLMADIQQVLENDVDISLPASETSKYVIRQQLTDFIAGKRSFHLSSATIYSANQLMLTSDAQSDAVKQIQKIIKKNIETLKALSDGYLSKHQKALQLKSLKNSCKELLIFFQ